MTIFSLFYYLSIQLNHIGEFSHFVQGEYSSMIELVDGGTDIQ